MSDDLDLDIGYRYSLITLTFFITYVIFQPPMTVLCRKIGPRIFLPGICLLWGVVIIGFGFANNWGTLVGLRLILGLMEAGYFPGCVYVWPQRTILGVDRTELIAFLDICSRHGTLVMKWLEDTPYSTPSEALLLQCPASSHSGSSRWRVSPASEDGDGMLLNQALFISFLEAK